MLAALRVSPDYDRVHLLTFGHQMIADLDKPSHNVAKLEQALGTPGKFVHETFDITPIIRYFYEGRGYLADVKKYGTLARAGTCTACDFAMFVQTILYCLGNGIRFACDGGNRSEFSGFLDEWGLESIQKFALSHGIEWVFPVYDDPRCDISLLKEGLEAPEPTLLYGQQACCRGVGLFANIHLRTYFLPKHGVEKYKELTLAWLEERFTLANELIERELTSRGAGGEEIPVAAPSGPAGLKVLG
ncbi:MAG TPA: hypothetical protein VLQ45_35005 [Thermoanaerobaculia bacterium]|nr:hypothetical protein [Thermoanaerobaculia bacterium]